MRVVPCSPCWPASPRRSPSLAHPDRGGRAATCRAAAGLRSLVEDLDEVDPLELDARLRLALSLEQRLEARLGPWLAKVWTRPVHRALGHRTRGDYAREHLGMDLSRAGALVRLERGIAGRPALERAYRSVALSWVKASTLARSRRRTIRLFSKNGSRGQGRSPCGVCGTSGGGADAGPDQSSGLPPRRGTRGRGPPGNRCDGYGGREAHSGSARRSLSRAGRSCVGEGTTERAPPREPLYLSRKLPALPSCLRGNPRTGKSVRRLRYPHRTRWRGCG
jgi:hypothetical protein